MHLIVGLGNPGAEYAQNKMTMLVSCWSKNWHDGGGWNGRWNESSSARGPRRCLRPTGVVMRTADAGESQRRGGRRNYRFYRLPPDRLVIVDDADLPFGEIRLRPGGSSGGHHGLESIEQHLSSREFARSVTGTQIAGTAPGRLPAMCSVNLTRPKAGCWKKFWNGRPTRWNAGWTRDCKRR